MGFDMELAGEDIQKTVKRFRKDLENPESLINFEPARHGFFLLQGIERRWEPDEHGTCLPYLQDDHDAYDSLLVADFRQGGVLGQLITSKVACKLGCGQVFPRH